MNDPKEIRKIQMKTWKFLIDITSVLPIEILAACFATEEQRWVAATFLRSNRLLRIYHVSSLHFHLNVSVEQSKNAIEKKSHFLFYLIFISFDII